MSQLATTAQNQQVADRLRAVRRWMGLSQSQFAQAMGLSPRAYANYERGQREPPLAVIRALLEHASIDPAWLLSGPGDTPRRVSTAPLDFDFANRASEAISSAGTALGIVIDRASRVALLAHLYEGCDRSVDLGPERLQHWLAQRAATNAE